MLKPIGPSIPAKKATISSIVPPEIPKPFSTIVKKTFITNMCQINIVRVYCPTKDRDLEETVHFSNNLLRKRIIIMPRIAPVKYKGTFP